MEAVRKVHYSDCDRGARLSPVSVLRMIQDCTSESFGERELDNMSMRTKYNAMWVLAKHRVRVYGRVMWREKLRATCKFVKVGAVRVFVLTEFKDENDKIKISSLSEFCVLDMATFRVIPADFLHIAEEGSCDDFKIDFPSVDMSEKFDFTVEPTMIDYSDHFNNVQSLPVFINTIDIDDIDTIFTDDYELVMRFCSQAKCGEKLTLNKGKSNVGTGYSVTKSDGAAVVIGHVKKL